MIHGHWLFSLRPCKRAAHAQNPAAPTRQPRTAARFARPWSTERVRRGAFSDHVVPGQTTPFFNVSRDVSFGDENLYGLTLYPEAGHAEYTVEFASAPDAAACAWIGRRYSLISMTGVALLSLGAAGLAYFYIATPDALYGTAYGLMVTGKSVLFAGLLRYYKGAQYLIEAMSAVPSATGPCSSTSSSPHARPSVRS